VAGSAAAAVAALRAGERQPAGIPDFLAQQGISRRMDFSGAAGLGYRDRGERHRRSISDPAHVPRAGAKIDQKSS
jgi:hypothetical protein